MEILVYIHLPFPLIMCITMAHLLVNYILGIRRDTAFKGCFNCKNGLYVSKNIIVQLKDSTNLFNIFLLGQRAE